MMHPLARMTDRKLLSMMNLPPEGQKMQASLETLKRVVLTCLTKLPMQEVLLMPEIYLKEEELLLPRLQRGNHQTHTDNNSKFERKPKT